ncbi:hypothetical protein IMZ48_07175 [Candidatus Bathyarchaeota archaeon]|nr:hypothetical protein [Candidatus Bathyarchaeota archaeon]
MKSLSLLLILPFAVGVFADAKKDKGPGILNSGGQPAQYRVHCETSPSSPMDEHVYEAVDMVGKGRDKGCGQTNEMGSHCSTMVQSTGAVIALCSSGDRELWELTCADVANMARAVAEVCTSEQEGILRAGGYVYREEITWNGWERWPKTGWLEVSTKP